jgi:hypothetical protein
VIFWTFFTEAMRFLTSFRVAIVRGGGGREAEQPPDLS